VRSFLGAVVAACLCWSLPDRTAGGGTQAAAGTEVGSFTAEQVRAAANDHVQAKLREGGGLYRMLDDKTGERLELEFVDVAIVAAAGLWRIHDPERGAGESGYFACVALHPPGAPRGKRYDVDVRFLPRQGKLEAVEARIHKEPRLVKGQWVMVPRFSKTR
jgi:hypothetical protein